MHHNTPVLGNNQKKTFLGRGCAPSQAPLSCGGVPLPIPRTVCFPNFKLLPTPLVYKAFDDLVPRYLSYDCQLAAVTSRRQLQSSDNSKCAIISTSSRLIRCCPTATVERSAHARPSTGFDTGEFLPQTENNICSRHRA